MTEDEIDAIFRRAREWSADRREHAAHLLRGIELGQKAAYEIFPEQRGSIEDGIADARAGKFASEGDVVEVFDRTSRAKQPVRYTQSALHSLNRIRAWIESPIVWTYAPGLVMGAVDQLGYEALGMPTTLTDVRCYVVPGIGYAIYYEATQQGIAILHVQYGARLEWAAVATA